MKLQSLNARLWKRIKVEIKQKEEFYMPLLPYLEEWQLLPMTGIWKGIALVENSRIMEVLLVYRDSLVFPVMLDQTDPSLPMQLSQQLSLSEYLDSLGLDHPTLIGPSSWVQSIFPNKRPGVWYQYSYLGREADPWSGLEKQSLRQIGKKDLESFMPLRELYEREEVIPQGQNWSPIQSRILFSKVLETQIFYGIFNQNGPIGLGGTNALGSRHAQLGGIFIRQDQRKKGYGGALVRKLCRHLYSMGYRTLLYVKKSNIPALKLYEKLGFQHLWDFTIGYLR